jgi:predicted ATPase
MPPSPDLPSAGTAPPASRTSFVGRERELAELGPDLADVPVTSLVGPAGVGKTRLAFEAVSLHGDEFADGVAVVLLADVRDPALVGAAVASSLGLPRTGGQPYERALISWLQDRNVLLVLDNCEHVLAAAAALADELTRELPGLRLLVTSREPLEVPGEAVHRLAPLPPPALGASDDEVAASEAVRLFVDRAEARDRRFDAEAAGWDSIAEICRRLDGLPLAIELAAARVGALAPAEICRRLDDRFTLLGGGVRTAELRHRTLRAAVEWSDALLDDDERRLLHRLSVFRGFDLPAASAVCGAGELDEIAVIDGISRLVDKSLVARDESDASRYFLLETIREFAAERLDAAGEAATMRDALADWFAEVGMTAGAALTAGNERQWLELLSADLENLRAALARLLDGPAPERGLLLAASLSLFWWTRGHLSEGIEWLRVGLDRAVDAAAELRAVGLFHLAFLWAHDTDDWTHAATLLDEALALVEETTEPLGSPILGYALCLRGQAANVAGEHQRALDLTTRGTEIVREFPDPWGAGFAIWNVGHTHEHLGDLDAAQACFEEVVEIQRAAGIGLVLMIGVQSVAEIAEARGELDRARELQEEALALRRDLGAARLGYVHGSLPGGLIAVARIALAQGDMETTRVAAAEALPLAEERHDAEQVAQARALLDAVSREDAVEVGVLRRQGAVWEVSLGEESALLPDAKGLRQLRVLLARPGHDESALALAAGDDGVARDTGDAGPLLDEHARRMYRERLAGIEDEIEEAERFHDPERAAAAQEEREALLAELTRATGLGGRERRAGSGAERARVNVTRTLREAIARIADECPTLGTHLDRSVRTGTRCSYEPAEPLAWQL